jgi:hypothetical protein
MNRMFVIAILLFTSAFLVAQAQEITLGPASAFTTEEERKGEEAGYYKLYNEGWTLRPNLGYKTFSFTIENNDSGRSLQYVPNVGIGIGCKFVYKAFGLGFTLALPSTDTDNRGTSRFQDFQFTFPLGRHGIDFTFQNYQGFYLNDEGTKTGSEFLQYPDMAGALIELRYYFAFNPNYSMKAAFNQTARQLRSTGSWLISTSLNAFIVSQGGGFIPLPYVLDFPELLGLDAMTFTGISVSGGYTYTWVWENDWFLTPALFLGTNFQNQTYFIAGGEYKQSMPFNPKISFKLSAGQHKDKYYYGASLVQNSMMAVTTENIIFTGQTLNFNIYYGIRL